MTSDYHHSTMIVFFLLSLTLNTKAQSQDMPDISALANGGTDALFQLLQSAKDNPESQSISLAQTPSNTDTNSDQYLESFFSALEKEAGIDSTDATTPNTNIPQQINSIPTEPAVDSSAIINQLLSSTASNPSTNLPIPSPIILTPSPINPPLQPIFVTPTTNSVVDINTMHDTINTKQDLLYFLQRLHQQINNNNNNMNTISSAINTFPQQFHSLSQQLQQHQTELETLKTQMNSPQPPIGTTDSGMSIIFISNDS